MAQQSTVISGTIDIGDSLTKGINANVRNSVLGKGLNTQQVNSAFKGATDSVKGFDRELDRANRRVLSFGAAATVVYGTVRAFKELLSASIEVEKSLASINSIVKLSQRDLDTFGKSLFNVARETGASFRETAAAALEFSRQGANAAETAKRTRDAMLLVRLTGIDTTKAVEGLTAMLATFNKTGIDSTQILNKLVAADDAFSVSAGGLVEAFTRVGSVVTDAGASLDQFIGLVTAARQITGRSEAVIGNALKTIFTRIERSDTLDKLEELGIQVRDASGAAKNAYAIFNELGSSYGNLTREQQKYVAELSAGVFQINQFKALATDLGKANGIAAQATETAANATNNALIRNAALNKTLATSIQTLKTSATQAAGVIGELAIRPALDFAIGQGSQLASLFQNLKASGDTKAAEDFGAYMGESVLKGLGNVLLGPGLILAMKAAVGTVYRVGRDAVADFQQATNLLSFKGSKREAETASLTTVKGLLNEATSAEMKRWNAAKGVAEQEAVILAIIERQVAAMAGLGRAAPIGLRGGARSTPRSAEGYVPMAEEASAIAAGIGGAPSSARPVYMPGFNRGGGQRGIVANTSEWMVPGAAGGSIYNRQMIQQFGLPPGAKPVAAGGYIPTASFGLPSAYSDPAYYRMHQPLNPMGGTPGNIPYVPGTSAPAMGQGFGQYTDPIAGAAGVWERTWQKLTKDISATLLKSASTINANAEIAGFGPLLKHGPAMPSTFLANQSIAGMGGAVRYGPASPSASYLSVQNAPIYQANRGSGNPANATAQQRISRGGDLMRSPGYYNANRIDIANGLIDAETGLPSAAEQRRIDRDIRTDQRRVKAQQEIRAREAALQRGARLDRTASRVQLGTIAASFGTAFLPEAHGGTASGMAIGAASGAGQASAVGAGIGALGGPLGTIIGALVGGLGGAIYGLISKSQKSFEELAVDIEHSNRKAATQVENAAKVFQLDDEETEHRANGASPRDIARIQRQRATAIASIPDKETRDILLSRTGNPLAREQAIRQAGGIASDTVESNAFLASAGKIKAGPFAGLSPFSSLTERDVEGAVSGITPQLVGLSDSQKKALGSLFRNDPAAAMQYLAKRGVNADVQKQVSAMFGSTETKRFSPNYLAMGGTGTTFGIQQSSFTETNGPSQETLSNATTVGLKALAEETASGARTEINAPHRPQVTPRYLLKLGNILARQAAIGGISREADLQINEASQRIALDRPDLFGTARIEKQGQFNAQNISARFGIQRDSTLLEGRRGLLKLIGDTKGAEDPAITNTVREAKSVADLKGIFNGMDPKAFPALRQAVQELTLQMEVLDRTQGEAINVNQAQVDLDTTAYRERLTLGGAQKEDAGAIGKAMEAFKAAQDRKEDPAVIEAAANALMEVVQRAAVRGDPSKLGNSDIQGLLRGLSTDVTARRRRNASVIGAANQGSELITGSMLEAAGLDEAQLAGQRGESKTSFTQGFGARFSGLKKDLLDLSAVGAQVASSLETNLGNAFGDFVTGAKRGKEAFRAFVLGVLGDSARAFATKAVQQLLGIAFASFAAPGTSGGGNAAGGPIGRAMGGGIPAVVMKGEWIYGPQEAKRIGPAKLAAINSGALQRRAGGGALVTGGSGYGDDVRLNLANGSYVVRKAMVDRYGASALAQMAGGGGMGVSINSSISDMAAPVPSMLRGYTAGGSNATVTAMPSMSGGSGGALSLHTSVTINDQRTSSSTSAEGNAGMADKRFGAQLSREIEQATLRVIEKQTRVGGMLRIQSLRGST